VPSPGFGAQRVGISDQVGSNFHIELPPDVAQLASLRRSLSDWFAGAEVGPRASEAVILATHEAVANAMEHAHAGVVVTGSRDQDRVTVVVRNSGGWKGSDGSEHRGSGLTLVRGLMSQVDIGSGSGGSVVRMQLTL
jgi:anti-sigma regulatory factor (Ser/Thr protein kinase)